MDKNVISVKTVEEKKGKFSVYTLSLVKVLKYTDFEKDVFVCACVFVPVCMSITS
jgi:hypothetical protein